MDGVRRESLDLAPTLESATLARRAVRSALTGSTAADHVADAELVVTELVGNAVLHARTSLTLEVVVHPGGVRIEVTDRSPSPVRPPSDDGVASMTGRGLHMVAAIAARWGVVPDGDGKRVWADIGEVPDDLGDAVAPDAAVPPAGLRRVTLSAVPTRLLAANDAHFDDLVRELQLLSFGAGTGALPDALAAAVADVLEHHDAFRLGTASRTPASGARVDVTVHVAADEAFDRLWLAERLDVLAEVARRGLLLGPPAPPELPAFRHWWANEVTRQLAGRPPSPCPFEVDPGPSWREMPGAEEIRLREARYRSLIEAAELDVWRANSDGYLVTDMPEWRSHTGQGDDEVLGYGWLDAVHPDDRDRVLATWERAVDEQGIYQCEYRITSTDGTARQIVARAVPVRERGELREWVGTTVDVTDQRRIEREIADQSRLVDSLHEIGVALVGTLDLQQLLQRLTEATTRVTEADFGAFFFNATDDRGESYVLYTLHGAPREAFDSFPLPRNTAIFAPTFAGERVVRYDDVTAAPEFGHNPPYNGMPEGHLPVRSYLAVPVISASGHVHGGLFFGHGEPGRFTEWHERVVSAIATQASLGIDNAVVFERQRAAGVSLQRSLLPQEHPPAHGFRYAIRYLPGQAGSEVGGDWYEVQPIDDARSLVAVGDVQGKGLHAAGHMGQVRAAVRAYGLAALPPDEALALLDRFWAQQSDLFTTCLYGIHDASTGRISLSSAGHLPPMLIRDGQVSYVAIDPAPPLGVGGAAFNLVSVELGAGDGLVLFTDGLVENRTRTVEEGMEELLDHVGDVVAAGWKPEAVADAAVAAMLDSGHDDDVAVVVLQAESPLSGEGMSAR